METNQTGGTGTPKQVENVQYNVNVGTVRSKVGLASTLSSLFGWATALMAVIGMLAIVQMVLPKDVNEMQQSKESLVVAISGLVPILPLFIFTVKRLNKALKENPANWDDLFFKKSIRFNLVLALIISCFWAITLVYNILAKFILNNGNITIQVVLNNLVFLLPPAALVYFYWTYQQKTKR